MPDQSGRVSSRCSTCRQTCAWPLGSLKHEMWMSKHDCRLLRPVVARTTPGQPGENGGHSVGLTGRRIAEVPSVASCEAETFPVWADGTQEHFRCEEPAGHLGPHVGDEGDWSWND